MSVPMSQVLTTIRTYLNDDNSTQFPDPVLIPKIQEAHRELQTELWVAGSPVVRGQLNAPYHYVANSYTLLPSSLGLPDSTQFLAPTGLFEAAWPTPSGTSVWSPMTEVIYIPLNTNIFVNIVIGWWAWQQEQFFFNSCSVDRSIMIQYRKLIAIPNLATDLIGILFGESYLAARAAAIAAGSVGNMELVGSMTALAKENLSKVMAANRGSQRSLMSPSGTTGWSHHPPSKGI